MSDQAVVDCLVAARKRIENPANWGKAPLSPGQECAMVALDAAVDVREIYNKASRLFYLAIQAPSMTQWNDAPERTHEEVLAAFDKAIELARSN